MQIRVLSSTLVDGVWHEPGVGNYDPKLANYLIRIGVAASLEVKAEELKKKAETKPGSSSQAAQASQKKTRGRRKNTTASQ